MLSLILPVRDWHLDRIHACLDSFIALGAPSLTEIVVVDFGSKELVVLRDGMHPMVTMLRIESKVWSLSEAINAGTLVARNDLIAKTDADILISLGSKDEFERMVADLAAERIGLGVCQATDLHQSLSVQDALDTVLTGRNPMGRPRAKWGQGGLVFFSRDYWNEIGGFEARFTGWGNEDNDFAERVRGHGRIVKWADPEELQIFHVWHPPTHHATGIIAQRQNNQKIAAKDKSILRPIVFHHSNFPKIAAPQIMQRIRPLVTLGIATTARPNRERMMREAIDSFRGQIDHDFEVLVVDNGSTADEVETLRAALGKIRWAKDLIRLESTGVASIPGARNLITAASRGRYIAVVDDDDLALENRLQDHLRNFEQNGRLHGSHGGWIDFDESTGIIERNMGKKRSIATMTAGSGKITAHPSSFYRADVMRAVPYDESFALGSDLDLALRMDAMGMQIGHTGSYVTLRRYHSSNVTITGTSNQVSNGAAAKARAISTYGWQNQANLVKAAQPDNGEIYCRNQMSLDTLIDLMPDYTGEWQFFIPFSDLVAPSQAIVAEEPVQPLLEDMTATPYGESGIEVPVAANDDKPTAMMLPAVSQQTLGQVLAIVGGDFGTRRSGLNMPLYFRSEPVATVRKAKKIRAALEGLLGKRVDMISIRQAEIDRGHAFDWKSLPTGSGERRLQSQCFEDVSTLLVGYAQLDKSSAMVGGLNIVSDHDEIEGERYFLVSPSIKGYDEVRGMQHDLQRCGVFGFRQIAGNGVETELTLSARSH